MPFPADGDGEDAGRVLDWRLLALACAPLAVLTYDGRGYNDAKAMTVGHTHSQPARNPETSPRGAGVWGRIRGMRVVLTIHTRAA